MGHLPRNYAHCSPPQKCSVRRTSDRPVLDVHETHSAISRQLLCPCDSQWGWPNVLLLLKWTLHAQGHLTQTGIVLWNPGSWLLVGHFSWKQTTLLLPQCFLPRHFLHCRLHHGFLGQEIPRCPHFHHQKFQLRPLSWLLHDMRFGSGLEEGDPIQMGTQDQIWHWCAPH